MFISLSLVQGFKMVPFYIMSSTLHVISWGTMFIVISLYIIISTNDRFGLTYTALIYPVKVLSVMNSQFNEQSVELSGQITKKNDELYFSKDS